MAAHDLNDGDRFGLVAGSVQADLTDGGGHIFGSASEPGCVVCEDQVIVNGLGNADETDAAFVDLGGPGEFAHGVHGVVSADV